MGASLEFYRIKAKNESEVKKEYERLVSDALYDHGHAGYTGTIAESPGLDIHSSVTVDTVANAEAYIDECAKKWENSVAVKIKDKDEWVIGGVYSC